MLIEERQNFCKAIAGKIRCNLAGIRYILICAIILFSVGIRVYYLSRDTVLQRDAIFYIDWIQDCVHENDKTIDQRTKIPGFFVKQVSLLSKTGITAENAARIYSITMGTMVVILFGLLAYEIFRETKYVLLAMLLAACHPLLIDYSIQPMREISYLCWCGLSIFCLLRGFRQANHYLIFTSGIFLMFTIFTRLEGFELFVYYALYFCSQLIYKKKECSGKIFSYAASMFGGIMIGFLFCLFFSGMTFSDLGQLYHIRAQKIQ